jgi:hypothetical protein
MLRFAMYQTMSNYRERCCVENYRPKDRRFEIAKREKLKNEETEKNVQKGK